MEKLIEIQSLINKARYHRNISFKDKKAIKICEKILTIDPENRDAMLIKAGALKSLSKDKEAVDLINTIIKKWPNRWEAYYLLAGHYFSIEEDEEALELIDKSIGLNETFDNVIQKAQMLYLIGKGNYMGFVEKARKIDKKRTENYMKNVWIYDMNNVKPTLGEFFGSLKSLIGSRSRENKERRLNDSGHEYPDREKADMSPVVEWVCQNSELMNHFNPLSGKYLQSKMDQTNFGMLLDGFIFDYKLPDGKTPFELYLEKEELSFSEKEDYKKLLDNVFSAFEILEVDVDHGMSLHDILNNKTYYVKEKKGTHGAEVGSMIECRIAKVGDSFEIIGPGGFKWPAEIVYSLKRLIKGGQLKDKKISLFDMLDIVLEIENKDNTLDGIKKEFKRKLKSLGIKFNFNDIDKRINESSDFQKAFPEIFKFNFPSMGEFKEVFDILTKLWNHYPRKEFSGKSPQDKGEYGPKEMMLMQSLLLEGTSKISPDKYPSPKEAVKAMERFKEEWLNTPQKELDGKMPREVILKERAQLGNPRKDISTQIQLNKIDDFDANKAEKLYFDALSAHKKGNFEGSVKLLKEVVEMYPENYKAWGNMGASYASLSKKEDAIKCLRKSLAINPRYRLAKSNLKAIENYNFGVDEKELLEMAVKSEMKGDYAKALGYIKEILVQSPRSYHSLFLKYGVNKKIGKPDITDLKLAFEEAKKQDASKEVLQLMEDELDDLGGAFRKINLHKFDKPVEKFELFDKKYQKKNFILSKPIKDYGKPDLTKDFFENNPLEMFSSACIGYNILINPEVERKTMRTIYHSLPKSGKDKVDREKEGILLTKDPARLLQIMKQSIGTLNENILMESILNFEDEIIPKLIDLLKDNSDDFLAERIIKFIYHAKTNYTKQILDALPSIKVVYNLSMTCMLLGLIGNEEAIKPLWGCYHFLKEEYPNESYNQGPLLGLYELKKVK